ncbi:MAG: class IV adenylate cyclase [Candidatus Falkowbacteria bacterium]
MQIEYEATFYPIDKDDIRSRLLAVGAELIRSEYVQERSNYTLPSGHEIAGGWIRVRNEGDKNTLTLKVVDGEKIENQREITTEVKDFNATKQLLEAIGCRHKATQTTKRELWRIKSVEIMIDEWPWLEPFVEIEGPSEIAVRNIAEKLGFDYKQAHFGAVDSLYAAKYGISKEQINTTEQVTFEGENPFK